MILVQLEFTAYSSVCGLNAGRMITVWLVCVWEGLRLPMKPHAARWSFSPVGCLLSSRLLVDTQSWASGPDPFSRDSPLLQCRLMPSTETFQS